MNKTFSILFISSLSLFSFAQSSPSMPSVGTIASPSMPTITAPLLGDGYYIPGNQTRASSQKKEKSVNSSSTSLEENKVTEKSAENNSSVNTSLLSAKDIESLKNLGALNSLSSIAGSSFNNLYNKGNLSLLNDGNANITNISSESQDAVSKIMLEKILAELESLKEKTLAKEENTDLSYSAEKNKEISQTAEEKNPSASAKKRVLRFMVNGYDILKTCRTIYISDMERDGTFLLTGDRLYESDGKSRTETFHILFRQKGTQTLQDNYSAVAAVSQDYLNEYSFLYQMAKRQSLAANRTGNFISMRTTDPDWKMEFLLDLGSGEKR